MARRSISRKSASKALILSERLEPRRLLCGVVSTVGGELRVDEGAAFVSFVDEDPAPKQSAPSVGSATITWTNRGSSTNDSDNFNSVFGANANTARNVIDQAILNWSRVISDYVRSDGT